MFNELQSLLSDLSDTSKLASSLQQAWNSAAGRQISLAEAQGLVDIAKYGTYSEFEREVYRLLGLTMQQTQANMVATPSGSGALMMDQLFNTVLFAPAKTEKEAEQQAEVQKSRLRPIIGGDLFYGYTKFSLTDQTMHVYGANLSGAFNFTDRLEMQATVPIYGTTIGDNDFATYGFDLATKYRILGDPETSKHNLSAGFHGNIIGNSSDFGSSYNWAIGPFVSYSYQFTDMFSVSTAALFDRMEPENGEDTWVSGFGLNLGFRLSKIFALNPYYIYYNNLDAPNSVDQDWHDLGLELRADLGKTWRLSVGGKTSLGYDPYDVSCTFYLGSAWRF